MDLDRSWARPAFRASVWITVVYVAILGTTMATSNVLLRVLPCRHGRGIELVCPLLGVDLYGVILHAGATAWYCMMALPLVLLVIAFMLIVGVADWIAARRKSPAS